MRIPAVIEIFLRGAAVAWRPSFFALASALACVLGGCAGVTMSQGGRQFRGVGQGPVIIAHRGGALEAPENTMAAFRHGLAVGADFLELDVTLSADDEVVVIHDATIDRTTNGEGVVREMSLAALRGVDASTPDFSKHKIKGLESIGVSPPDFSNRFPSQSIPTLQQALALQDARVMIELKSLEGRDKEVLVEGVLEIIRDLRAWDRVIVGSFDTQILWLLKDREPSLALIGIAETEEELRGHQAVGPVVMAVNLELLARAKEILGDDATVWVWTVDTVDAARWAHRAGAHGVITDVPQAVVKAFRAPPPLYIESGDVPMVGDDDSDSGASEAP